MSLANVNLANLSPAPTQWDPVFFHAKRRPSAVLVLFVNESDETVPNVVMIRRSSKVGSHRGQIGFPGGRMELHDVSPAATALREASEEIALDPIKTEILGSLPAVPALDGSLVFPVVGQIMRGNFAPQPSDSEVQLIHQISAEKLNRSNCAKFSFNMFGCWRDSFLYDCGEISVWGLSAEILARANF